MHLTLFVPDLLWPDHDHRQAFEFDQASQLARFLSLAAHTATPFSQTDSWESVLAQTFGLSDRTSPLGALRLLGESDEITDNQAYGRTLLCADPVSLDFIQQSLVLSSLDAAQLSFDDASRLIASLNEEFSGEGSFFTGSSPAHWYFAPKDAVGELPNLAACSRLLGRRIDADESRQVLGQDGLRWLNRIQMCLNDHPVNEERQMNGLTTINSVWPWGAGLLDANTACETPPFDWAVGNSALLRGLCMLTGTTHTPQINTSSSGLLLDTSLATAIAQDDMASWQKAVNTLTLTRIAPALSALVSGELDSLTIIAPDSYQTHQWTLASNHKNLRPSLIQRLLGQTHKHAALATLVRSW